MSANRPCIFHYRCVKFTIKSIRYNGFSVFKEKGNLGRIIGGYNERKKIQTSMRMYQLR